MQFDRLRYSLSHYYNLVLVHNKISLCILVAEQANNFSQRYFLANILSELYNPLTVAVGLNVEAPVIRFTLKSSRYPWHKLFIDSSLSDASW